MCGLGVESFVLECWNRVIMNAICRSHPKRLPNSEECSVQWCASSLLARSTPAHRPRWYRWININDGVTPRHAQLLKMISARCAALHGSKPSIFIFHVVWVRAAASIMLRKVHIGSSFRPNLSLLPMLVKNELILSIDMPGIASVRRETVQIQHRVINSP